MSATKHTVTTLRTLVIEQERMPLEALCRVIEGEQDLVCVAAGRDPQIGADLGSYDVDVVLLGAQLPGIDVVAATGQARLRFPTARIVVVAGYVDDRLRDAAFAEGADAVVDTSIALDDLLGVLRTGIVPERATAAPGRDHHSSKLAEVLGITVRQYEVLRLLAKGHSADQVARALAIKVATCRDHIKALHRTLDCCSTTEMLVVSAQLGLLPELGRPYR